MQLIRRWGPQAEPTPSYLAPTSSQPGLLGLLSPTRQVLPQDFAARRLGQSLQFPHPAAELLVPCDLAVGPSADLVEGLLFPVGLAGRGRVVVVVAVEFRREGDVGDGEFGRLLVRVDGCHGRVGD